MRHVRLLLLVLPSLLWSLDSALAQCLECEPGDDDTVAPTIDMPTGGLYKTASVSVTIEYTDNVELGGPLIELNDVDVRTDFSVTYSGSPPTSATATGTITLTPGSNSLWTRICDASSNCTEASAGYTYDDTDPTVGISPGTSYTTSSSQSVTISWGDNMSLDASSRQIKLNGSLVTSSFDWSGTSTSATSSGSVNLTAGSNTLYAYICDSAGRCASQTVTYTYDNADPGVSISPGTSTIESSSTSVTIDWTDNLGLNASSRIIELNGTSVTSSFSYSGTSTSATSSGTVSLDPGDNTLYAYICDNAGRCSSKTVTYTRPHTYTVSVTPDGGSGTTPAGESDSFAFTVVNDGNTGTTYDLTATCTGSGATSTCAPSSTSVTLSAGAGTTVNLNYGTAYGGTTVDISLQASGSGESDTGSATIELTYSGGDPVAPVIVATGPLDQVVDRASCLAVGLAEAAAASCGDLRIVHPLPAMRSMNKSFAPTLVYSAAATGPALVAMTADIALPSGGLVPDSVTADLTVDGASRRSAWSGSHWVPGSTIRIVAERSNNTTGILPYDLTVTNWYGATPYSATGSGTLLHVSRSTSEFGDGWSLAGLEELRYVGQSRMLWTGGDGSARIYDVTTDPDVWRGVNRARPDSIIWDGTHYVRMAPAGVEVRFNTSGDHVETRDRNANSTTFAYAGGLLDRITLPTAGGVPPYYKFNYGSNGRLTAVAAYGAGGTAARTTQFSIPSARVESITDPDGTIISFEYANTTTGLIRFRDVQDGTRTEFLLNGARHVQVVRQYHADGSYVQTSLRHQEGQGLDDAGIHQPAQLNRVHTWIDGPRPGISDTSRFYLNAYSEPDSISDPLGHWTRVITRDADFPALVTRVREPNGREIAAAYDSRGRITSMTDYGTTDGSSYATTTYTWSAACQDFPDRITNPEGDWIEYGYDLSCNRSWRQDARGTMSRVSFHYNAHGQLSQIDPPLSASTTVAYDPSTGNVASVSRDGTATSFEQDAWGADTLLVTPVTDSISKRTRIRFDAMGRDTLTVDEASGSAIETHKTYGRGGLLLSVTTEVDPDPNGIGAVTHTYTYDRLGRMLSDVGGGTSVSWVYDEAGNVTGGGPRPAARGYDANSRMISEGSSTFVYDAAGNLLAADNEFARVRRGYDLAGRITTDTLWIAQFDSSSQLPNGFSSSSHVYVLRYGYDLNGRPVWQQHSSNLAPSTSEDSISYAYTGAGFLDTVEDVMGNTYLFGYDAEGRPTRVNRLIGTDSVWDTMAYDARSRLNFRKVLSTTAGELLHEDPAYDHLDRVISNSAAGESYEYHPLGPLTYGLAGSTESFETDVLARRVSSNSKIGQYPALTYYYYEPGTGVLEYTEHVGMSTDTTTYQFNSQGGQQYQERIQLVSDVSSVEDTVLVTRTDNAYDGQFRLSKAIFTADTIPIPYSLYESYRSEEGYWYDALGRRVLVWSWKQSNCENKDPTSGCLSTVTRTMWSGNQVAYEIRAPWSSPDSDTYTGLHYGRVGYLHVGGIDQPLALWKGSEVVHPHLNARGIYRIVTCGLDACDPVTDDIDIPGNRLSLFGADRNPPPYGPKSWYGSLVTGQIDASGYLYRRNRYVDPRNGTFTQPDPIGIAGGLNIFGYANGDPVSYSDPFGLCPWCEEKLQGLANWGARRGGVAGWLALNGGAAGVAALEVSGVNDAFAAVDAAGEGRWAAAAAGAFFALPGGKGGKAARALVGDFLDNPGNWNRVGAFIEAATNRRARGGASIQEIFENADGERIIQHTVVDRAGRAIDGPHPRPWYNPRVDEIDP
ncbi:MAG TPA: RHS repeat-associated core domain-containing protein [Longimicrobiales bacterium]|nr:RHS repeat-associated core domain-containing protein [Longimicrobiales bacterium]